MVRGCTFVKQLKNKTMSNKKTYSISARRKADFTLVYLTESGKWAVSKQFAFVFASKKAAALCARMCEKDETIETPLATEL